MDRDKHRHYSVKITADEGIYEELLRNGNNITLKYPSNCKRCKRHRKNVFKKK